MNICPSSVSKAVLNNWNWVFNRSNPDEVNFVVENDNGTIVGFANGGKCRSEEYHYDSELLLHILARRIPGTGYGKALFSAVVNHLRIHNYQSLMVWVLEKNPATAFYYRLGAEAFTKKDIQIGNDTVTELGLGWNELL
jgi:L-amino acid N-acyltransferase YncA